MADEHHRTDKTSQAGKPGCGRFIVGLPVLAGIGAAIVAAPLMAGGSS